MIGNFDLPQDKSIVKTFVFNAMGPIALSGNLPQGFRTWQKPKGITFVHGLIIGAGAGGGGGGTGGGGGGGASGGILTFLIPAYAVPDQLLVSVANGGKGGGSNANGAIPTVVTALWYSTLQVTSGTPQRTNFAFANAINSTPQGLAGGTTGGAGGTASSVATITAATANLTNLVSMGNAQIQIGSVGQAGTTGAGANAPFIGRPQGGASGGGISGGVGSAGGNVLAPSFGTQTIWNRNLLGGTATGQAGEDGISLTQPTLFNLPGAGGGANVGGTGGRGGKGGIGCGGGGGGAGTTGGAGGDGGDGLIILTCW